MTSMRTSISQYRASALLASTILASLSAPALGQAVPTTNASDEQSSPASTADIVVTGSRIRNGNNAPTPITVTSAEQLQATTPSSIPDGLNKLPIFNAGQNTPNNASNSNGRGFGAPGNFLNLRSLGPMRTLILQDGNRVPGTLHDTTVDTDMLPQLLIQRVEVVTGAFRPSTGQTPLPAWSISSPTTSSLA